MSELYDPLKPPKPVSILEALAIDPMGDPTEALTLSDLSGYLVKHLGTDFEKKRNAMHALRDELYKDGGNDHMAKVIDHVFVDMQVRTLRKNWIEYAKFNNALKRVVNELSTVYAVPAVRSVNGASDNEKYQRLLEYVSMDEQMLHISRLANLHRTMLVGFRVRKRPDGTREPALDHATPANVRTVLHPNDNRIVLGWCVRRHHRTWKTMGRYFDNQEHGPAWTLWTAFERVALREDMSVIPDTYKTHDLGVCPWVPLQLSAPGTNWWPGEEGEDLVAAHLAIWFSSILMLKEEKSSNKQTVVKGESTQSARGQAGDSEVPLELADGQSVQTIDTGMDLAQFRLTADHILQNAAQNYGMSPGIITHQGVQSAEARELMRMPLRELRLQQQIPFRRFEELLAHVISAVLKVDLPELAFDADGFRIKYGETQTPQTAVDKINTMLAGRAAGITDTVEFVMDENDLPEDEAVAAIAEHVARETWRNQIMRPLVAISGSMGAQMPGKGDPQADQPGAKIAKEGDPQSPSNVHMVTPLVNSGPVPEIRQRGGAGAEKPAFPKKG